MEIFNGWYKLKGEQIEDLEEYILKQFAERQKSCGKNDIELIIGTDAMVKSYGKKLGKPDKRTREISYMTVIVFKKGNNGSHVVSK